MADPNPETARAIMRAPRFYFTAGMKGVATGHRLTHEDLQPYKSRQWWRNFRRDGIDYTDARTAGLLDEVVPGWREEVTDGEG